MQIRFKDKASLYPNKTNVAKNGYGKRTEKPTCIVIHSTNNPDGNTVFETEVDYLYKTRRASAEYLVGAEEIVQFFNPDVYYTWNAGEVRDKSFSNEHIIGIETHYSPADTLPFDRRILSNLTELVKQLIVKYAIPEQRIQMHRSVCFPVKRKSDPSWCSDQEFYAWRKALYIADDFVWYTVVKDTQIYTAPDHIHVKATHITEGTITSGVILIGTLVRGKIVTGQTIANSNKWLWISNGWGFIHSSDITPFYATTPRVYTKDSSFIGFYEVNKEKILNFIFNDNPHCKYTKDEVLGFIDQYIQLGKRFNLDYWLIIAQSLHETGKYTSFWSARPQRNGCGYGVEGNKQKYISWEQQQSGLWAFNSMVGLWEYGVSFDTWKKSIDTHVAHLLSYIYTDEEMTEDMLLFSSKSLRKKNIPPHYRGKGKQIQGLTQTWAVSKVLPPDGERYHDKIIKLANSL